MSASSSSIQSGSSAAVFVDFDLNKEKEKLASVLPISQNARTVFDLSEAERNEMETRMMPNSWSEVGFLKLGDRLLSVCIQDGLTLLEAKVPCYLIADVLSGILEAAKKSPGKAAPIVGGKFRVDNARLATNGYQECPFSLSENTPCHVGRADPVITNITNGKSILANDLTIEMIRNHFFFQTGPYRIDPRWAIECLELETTTYERVKEYRAKYCEFDYLNPNESDIKRYEAEKTELTRHASPFSIAPGVTGYVLPFKNRENYEYDGFTVEEKIRKQGALRGLTEEAIEAELNSEAEWGKWYSPPRTRMETLSRVIHRKEQKGDQFLHVFNDKALRNNNFIQEINGFKLSDPIKDAGIYIFELTTRMHVPIEPDPTPVSKKRKKGDPFRVIMEGEIEID